MKKLLSLLTIVTVSSSVSATVISCNTNTTTKQTLSDKQFQAMVSKDTKDFENQKLATDYDNVKKDIASYLKLAKKDSNALKGITVTFDDKKDNKPIQSLNPGEEILIDVNIKNNAYIQDTKKDLTATFNINKAAFNLKLTGSLHNGQWIADDVRNQIVQQYSNLYDTPQKIIDDKTLNIIIKDAKGHNVTNDSAIPGQTYTILVGISKNNQYFNAQNAKAYGTLKCGKLTLDQATVNQAIKTATSVIESADEQNIKESIVNQLGLSQSDAIKGINVTLNDKTSSKVKEAFNPNDQISVNVNVKGNNYINDIKELDGSFTVAKEQFSLSIDDQIKAGSSISNQVRNDITKQYPFIANIKDQSISIIIKDAKGHDVTNDSAIAGQTYTISIGINNNNPYFIAHNPAKVGTIHCGQLVLDQNTVTNAIKNVTNADAKNDVKTIQTNIVKALGLKEADAMTGIEVTLTDKTSSTLKTTFNPGDQISVSVSVKNNSYIADTKKPLIGSFNVAKESFSLNIKDQTIKSNTSIANLVRNDIASQYNPLYKSASKVHDDTTLNIIIKDAKGHNVTNDSAIPGQTYTILVGISNANKFFNAQNPKEVGTVKCGQLVLDQNTVTNAIKNVTNADANKDAQTIKNNIVKTLGLTEKDAMTGINVTLTDKTSSTLKTTFNPGDQISVSVSVKGNSYIADTTKPLTGSFTVAKENFQLNIKTQQIQSNTSIADAVRTDIAKQYSNLYKNAGAVKDDKNLSIIIKENGKDVKSDTSVLNETYTIYIGINKNDQYFNTQNVKEIGTIVCQRANVQDVTSWTLTHFKAGKKMLSSVRSDILYELQYTFGKNSIYLGGLSELQNDKSFVITIKDWTGKDVTNGSAVQGGQYEVYIWISQQNKYLNSIDNTDIGTVYCE